MPLFITFDNGVTISFEQAVAIKRIEDASDGLIHWHPNDCGCCLTVHAPDCAYVIDQDGGETRFEGRGCQCPPDR